MQALLGIIVLLALSWLMSENRAAISWRFVFIGIVIQGVLAALSARSMAERSSADDQRVCQCTVRLQQLAPCSCSAFGWRRFPSSIHHPVALHLCFSSAASSRSVLGRGRLALALAGAAYSGQGVKLGVAQNIPHQRHRGHRRSGEPLSWHD